MTDTPRPSLDAYFEGCLYFSLARLERQVNRMAEAAFKPLDLAPSHAFLLMAMAEAPGVGASALAETLGLAPSTVTRLVDKLETRGLCQREGQGRAVEHRLTPQGEALLPDLDAGWKRLFNAYNTRFGKAAADELNRMVVKFNSVD